MPQCFCRGKIELNLVKVSPHRQYDFHSRSLHSTLRRGLIEFQFQIACSSKPLKFDAFCDTHHVKFQYRHTFHVRSILI